VASIQVRTPDQVTGPGFASIPSATRSLTQPVVKLVIDTITKDNWGEKKKEHKKEREGKRREEKNPMYEELSWLSHTLPRSE